MRLADYLPSSEEEGHQPHPNYELTFKKDTHDRYFAHPHPRALFPTPPLPLPLPLPEYYAMPMEQLASLPFADLLSQPLAPWAREKVSLVGMVLELKRVRIKMRSANINLQCLRVRESLSHEDKHRLFLLELLAKQLTKKTFLQALKLHLAHRKYQRLFAEQEQRDLQQSLQEEEEDYEHSDSGSLWESKAEVGEDVKGKLMILAHSISHMLLKTLFFSFNKIAEAEGSQRGHSQCESIPIVSRPNIIGHSEDEQEPQEDHYRTYEHTSPQITYSKLEELENLIENLHQYCAENSQDLLKKYFVKWKITLLEAIASSELNKLRDNSMSPRQQADEEEEEEEERQEQYRQSRVSQASALSRESRLTSQVSEGGRTLKQEKKALKELIKYNAIRSFYDKLRSYSELRKIQLICLEIRRQDTLRRCFQALQANVQEEQLAREMSVYYEETANRQVQDDGTCKLFHKTTLLFTFFKRFKENLRDSKMARALSQLALKLAFRRVVSYGGREKRVGQAMERKAEKSRKHMMFKCFQGWKQFYRSESCYNEQFRQHMLRKERETLQHYFSLLKLQFKRALLRDRRAEQYYCNKLKATVFQAMLFMHEDGKELREKTSSLESYLLYSRGRDFMGKFRQFYTDYISYQRFSIKEEKLRRTLIRLHALEAVKEWRKNKVKREAYEAIEMKLVRIKNREKKREILAIWRERARRGGVSGGGSERHKEWLVKYYGDLCAVLPS